MVKKKIFFLYVLVLISAALFSQHQRLDVKEKLHGTWKRVNNNDRVYTQFLIFTDRNHGKSLIIDSPDYPNGTHETPFKYKIEKNGNVIIFNSTDPKKPEINRRMIRFSSDTLIISVRSSIYFASTSYIKQ